MESRSSIKSSFFSGGGCGGGGIDDGGTVVAVDGCSSAAVELELSSTMIVVLSSGILNRLSAECCE